MVQQLVMLVELPACSLGGQWHGPPQWGEEKAYRSKYTVSTARNTVSTAHNTVNTTHNTVNTAHNTVSTAHNTHNSWYW